MNAIDIVVLVVLILGFLQGIREGFAKSLCSFAGFTVGLLAAYFFYKTVGSQLAPHLGKNTGLAPILAFILIWIAVPIALNFVGDIITKFFDLLMLGAVNKMAGGVLGVVKYFLSASLVIYVLVLMGFLEQETTDQSFFGSMMVTFVESFMSSVRANV